MTAIFPVSFQRQLVAHYNNHEVLALISPNKLNYKYVDIQEKATRHSLKVRSTTLLDVTDASEYSVTVCWLLLIESIEVLGALNADKPTNNPRTTH